MRSLERNPKYYGTATQKAEVSLLAGINMGLATKDIEIGIDTTLWVAIMLGCVGLLQDMSVAKRMRKGRTYDLGHFGEIYGIAHRGRKVTLDDGTVINPGDIIGRIDLSQNLQSSLSQNQFTGVFLRSFSYAMVRLANDVEHKHFSKEIKAITGTTHLARPIPTRRLGFTVVEEKNLFRKYTAAKYGVSYTRDYDKSEPYLRLFKREWNHVHTVWMSRKQIVESKPLFQELRRRLKNSKSFKALTA